MSEYSFLFLLFLVFFPLTHAQRCQTSECKDGIRIRFPFGQESRNQDRDCIYPGFALGCSNRGKTVLNLPNSEDFLVRNINYVTQEIFLYDQENCLPKRLLNLDLSGSPFNASYHNYTFLSCPAQLTKSRYNHIDCLSNSTTSVLATASRSDVESMNQSCQIIKTVPIPVSWPVQYDEGFTNELDSDLLLTWGSPDCRDCETRGGLCGFRNRNSQQISCFPNPQEERAKGGLHVFRILCLSIAIPAVTCAVVIGISTCCMDRCRRGTTQRDSTLAAVNPHRPNPLVVGLDDSTIESYQKVVLGESKRLPGGPNDGTCPICLSEYCSKDTVRCIPECKHCFHAECVDAWLRVNSTCPVCRKSPSHSPGEPC